MVSWVDSGAFGCTRCTFQRLQYGLRCGLKCVWLHQVGVSAFTRELRSVLAAPGGRFRTQGKRELNPRRVGADPPVGTLWPLFYLYEDPIAKRY